MQPYLKLVYYAFMRSQNYELHMWVKENLFFYHLINVFYHQCNVYYFVEFRVPEFDGETNIHLPSSCWLRFYRLGLLPFSFLLFGQNNYKLFSLPLEVSFPVLFLSLFFICGSATCLVLLFTYWNSTPFDFVLFLKMLRRK